MARADSLAMIETFIGFPTVSRDSNLPLIDFVADHLAAAGAEVSRTQNADGRKANLLASFGARDRPGMIFSGHTDVVPVEDQVWTSDPFRLTRKGDRLIGRGTCDMKGFLAIATATIPRLAKLHPEKSLHLAYSYDEEVGCLGVHDLLADIGKRLAPARGCIVGEPTGMSIIAAHKGKIGLHVEVTGLEAHSSLTHAGVSAVEAAGEAIAYLKRRHRQFRQHGPFSPLFTDPAHSTIAVCMMSGGTAVNVIPSRASFDLEIRSLPGDDPMDIVEALKDYVREELEPEMKAIHPAAGFTFTLVPGCAAFRQDPDDPFVSAVRSVLPAQPLGAVPFGTEAGHFRDAGIPTLVCGPGSIAQAHKPDEFITLDDVSGCEGFLERLIGSD